MPGRDDQLQQQSFRCSRGDCAAGGNAACWRRRRWTWRRCWLRAVCCSVNACTASCDIHAALTGKAVVDVFHVGPIARFTITVKLVAPTQHEEAVCISGNAMQRGCPRARIICIHGCKGRVEVLRGTLRDLEDLRHGHRQKTVNYAYKSCITTRFFVGPTF